MPATATRTFHKLDASTLGTPALKNVLAEKADRLVSAGAASVRPDARNALYDSDLNFCLSRNGRRNGQATPASVVLSVSGHAIDNAGSDTLLDTLKRFIEIADRSAPTCGLVDVARPDDAFAGLVYGTAWPRTAPLHRWTEQMAWNYSGANKADRLRGVYWGNYLGSKVLQQVGGRAVFLNACTNNARSFDGTPNSHRWDFSNGVFVSLCLNPQECRPGAPLGLPVAAEANLRWLLPELGSKGVLNHW